MYICLTECMQTVKCSHCHEEIALHSPMIKGEYWSSHSNNTGSVKYRHQLYWHVSRASDSVCCWIEQGLTSLHLRQLTHTETRGGKTMLLTADIRSKRLQLLQRHARLMQMLREEMEKLATDDITTHPTGSWQKVANIGLKLDLLKEQIAPMGGVPTTWLTEEEIIKTKTNHLEMAMATDLAADSLSEMQPANQLTS